MFHRRVAAALALLPLVLPGLAGAAGIELISKTPPRQAPDTPGGDFPLDKVALSADGRFMAFASAAPNLVPGQDPELGLDVFFHDRITGTTRLISHASGAPATAGDGPSDQPAISADGRFVAFISGASNLVDGTVEVSPLGGHLYLWDRETERLTLISRRTGGEGGSGFSLTPSLSADGGVLVFSSTATDLISGSVTGQNVYAYERASGTLSLVSRSAGSSIHSGNRDSSGPVVSADGRFVAYLSGSVNLVAGVNDANGLGEDVFLFDRLTGITTLVSHVDGSALTTPNGGSHAPSLSADGRYVAFGSFGTNLLPGVTDDNREPDAFLYDRLTGTITWVSLSGTGIAEGGFEPKISAGGGTVAYFPDRPVQGSQIVAYDVLTGSRRLVTRTHASPSTPSPLGARSSFSLSADGRTIAFASAAKDLVAGQEDLQRSTTDVFLHDLPSGVTVLASHAPGSATRAGDESSDAPILSADGRWIAYPSSASNLVAGVRDAPLTTDLFLYETATGANRLVTRHAPGLASRTARFDSQEASVSADGRYVAFTSRAALLPGLVAAPGRANVYLHDRVTRRTVLVSRSTQPGLAGGNADSQAPRISRNGGAVVFVSRAGDLVPRQEDQEDTLDIFHWDRLTGRTTLVSRAHASRTRAVTGEFLVSEISADGNFVAFTSAAEDLAPQQRDFNQGRDVFLWDRRSNSIVLVSHHSNRPGRTGNGESFFRSMSPDGAFIAFDSQASDLILPVRDLDGLPDAFVFERRTGRIYLLGRPEDPGSIVPMISANGRWAAVFTATGEGDRGGAVVFDRLTGTTLEVAPSAPDLPFPLSFSDNGRWLLFGSGATDLVPGQKDDPFTSDLFLFDRVTREIRLVSHAPGDPLQAGGASNGRFSPDGRWIAFQSDSRFFLPDGSPRTTNIFLYDRTTGEVILASRSIFNPLDGGNGPSIEPVVTNGGLIAFSSQAADLIPRDFNFGSDVFVYIPGGGL